MFATIIVHISQGIVLGLLRLNEPIFKRIIYGVIRSWFGILTEYAMDDIKNANELLNQQLSTDLVYTILVSITDHTVGNPKSKFWIDYQKYDFANKNEITIESMIV